MGLRADWVAAKTAAKKANHNTEVKFPAKLDLGPALDKLEAAEKEYEKHAGEYDAAWAKATDAWIAAARKANTIGVQYQQAVAGLTATDAAKAKLNNFLVMKLFKKTTKVASDGRRLEPKLAQTRKKKD
jgi:hypothetical protein